MADGLTAPHVLTPDELQAASIIAWIEDNAIKNEKGDPIEFTDHPFLYDIYRDPADELVVVKCAQCGLSTCEILRNHHAARHRKMDIIYTLPTDNDVSVFVGGKVNRIIANNPCMVADVADKDSIEQKQVGQSMIYFRGTWTKKAAIMISADRLSHDEKDSSKQDVVEDYKARLDSPTSLKQRHTFSHPSVPNSGVDVEWQASDQKEWFIECPHCHKHQYLSWDTANPAKMSVDLERQEYICKKCHGILSDEDRRRGYWRARFKDRKISGYHISQLMSPRISAAEICKKWQTVLDGRQTEEYFHNKVLGTTYAGSGNSVVEDTILGAVTNEKNPYEGRIVIGVDTGIKLRYVVGNKSGLLGFGEVEDYEPHEPTADDPRPAVPLDRTLEYFLIKFPDSIMVIDQGGDIIGSRKLQKKYPGRVFLCHYARDRKTQQLMRWGDKEEFGTVLVDRNRLIQLVVDEFVGKRIPLYNGTRADWHSYWLHWSHIYRTAVEDKQTSTVRYVWMRSDRDDWVHATVYWRVGVSRFGGTGMIAQDEQRPPENSYVINPDGTTTFSPEDMFKLPDPNADEDDWRG